MYCSQHTTYDSRTTRTSLQYLHVIKETVMERSAAIVVVVIGTSKLSVLHRNGFIGNHYAYFAITIGKALTGDREK